MATTAPNTYELATTKVAGVFHMNPGAAVRISFHNSHGVKRGRGVCVWSALITVMMYVWSSWSTTVRGGLSASGPEIHMKIVSLTSVRAAFGRWQPLEAKGPLEDGLISRWLSIELCLINYKIASKSDSRAQNGV